MLADAPPILFSNLGDVDVQFFSLFNHVVYAALAEERPTPGAAPLAAEEGDGQVLSAAAEHAALLAAVLY